MCCLPSGESERECSRVELFRKTCSYNEIVVHLLEKYSNKVIQISLKQSQRCNLHTPFCSSMNHETSLRRHRSYRKVNHIHQSL